MTASTAIRAGTPLLEQGIRAVNFFNGRLVTSGDMLREQDARREGDARLGQAIGGGVVQGLEVQRDGQPADRRLSIKAGLAVNGAGQTLCLGADQVLALVPSADDDAPPTSAGFGACAQLSGGTYVAGDGLYLVTLAPASRAEGKAPVLALEPGNLRCNTDVIVEAVQLRLLRIGDDLRTTHGLDTNVIGPQAISRLRSRAAGACLGLPLQAAAHVNPGIAGGLNLLEDMRDRGLARCDVPLALVFLTASGGLLFVDRWAVRRRVAAATGAPPWNAWLGQPMAAAANAQLAQFQEQLDDIPTTSLTGLQASQWFAWLPPAGFLRTRGTEVGWQAFLEGRKPARTVPLAPGNAPAVLAEALRRDAIDLSAGSSQPGLRVYAIDGGPKLFVRDARNARHAAEVWFDGQQAQMPQANEVQSAIEQLWRRSCAHVVVRAGMAPEEVAKLLRDAPSGKDLMVCIEAGNFTASKPWRIEGLRHVVIRGHGAASLLRCEGAQAALVVESCESLVIDGAAFEALEPRRAMDDEIGRGGALTVIDVPDVRLSRVHASCGEDQELRAMAMLVTHRKPRDDALRRVQVEDCVLEVGAGQQGLGCVHCDVVTVRGNIVRAADPKAPLFLGIAVVGEKAWEVRVEHNVVLAAVQGVKVALSTREDFKTLSAEHVLLQHNRIEVAAAEGAEGVDSGLSFGLGIGNARSVLVRGNHVTVSEKALERVKKALGLHLHGEYGPRLLVRENHFIGSHGVAVELTATGALPAKGNCLWVFDYNVAEQVEAFLELAVALQNVVERNKNLVA